VNLRQLIRRVGKKRNKRKKRDLERNALALEITLNKLFLAQQQLDIDMTKEAFELERKRNPGDYVR